MHKRLDIKIFPDKINDLDFIIERASKKARVPKSDIKEFAILKKSIDARGSRPFFLLNVELSDAKKEARPSQLSALKNVKDAQEVIVVGAGPAGYFAALQLIEQGYRPIVLDRGKDVQARRRDLRAIQQEGIVNPHSNYCFGEGGAGTYSDGKLYTRSHKRGKIEKVLHLLTEHGATEDILVDAHPHIGSNKLPKIVSKIRETIEAFGGSVLFDTCVEALIIESGGVRGVVLQDGSKLQAAATILATGHSARDIYKMLHRQAVSIEAKPFALGLRIEHPQSLIDKIQYNQPEREENLPAASYSLVSQIKGNGVFSFCMCPGGLIVPAATAPGEIVVNGMSLSKRDSPFSNSGVVTSISLEELDKKGYNGVFACMDFQAEVERNMFDAGNGSQQAPAQLMTDFIKGRHSSHLLDTSYIPGLFSADIHNLLPSFVAQRLSAGLDHFGRKMKGYLTSEAQVVGVESRTSAPIRIPRNKETFMSEQLDGFFPCGEGAGYAGGILSAAMDGQNVAKGVATFLTKSK